MDILSEQSRCADTRPSALPPFYTESAVSELLRSLRHIIHYFVWCPVHWRGKERGEENLPFTSFQRDLSLCRLPGSSRLKQAEEEGVCSGQARR